MAWWYKQVQVRQTAATAERKVRKEFLNMDVREELDEADTSEPVATATADTLAWVSYTRASSPAGPEEGKRQCPAPLDRTGGGDTETD